MSSMRWILYTLLASLLGTSCFVALGPDRYGHWWRKEPLPEETAFFERARDSSVSPEEAPANGTFVGWFGIPIGIEQTQAQAELELDHRYAGELNIYYGVPDSAAITTVSLFGGGRFQVRMPPGSRAGDWLPGDLLRAYGTIASTTASRYVVDAVFVRHWPRWAYELDPLQPVRQDGKIVRQDGWPNLALETSVASAETPIDAEVRSRLLRMFQSAPSADRLRIAFTLGELGGPTVVEALEAATATETDSRLIAAYERDIARARRKIGPIWKPELPYPHWKGLPSAHDSSPTTRPVVAEQTRRADAEERRGSS